MLMIRFARRGKKNKPFFRVVVSEKARDTVGPALETVGWYDPSTPTRASELNGERITYWLSKGAQASPSVHNLLIDKKIVTGVKTKVYSPRKKKAEK